jgi:hypothetical protein
MNGGHGSGNPYKAIFRFSGYAKQKPSLSRNPGLFMLVLKTEMKRPCKKHRMQLKETNKEGNPAAIEATD